MNLTPITLDSLEAAEIQLRRAILLFFDEEDFVSALTLAGAAEELLGKLLQEKGHPSALDSIVKHSIRLEEKFSGSCSSPKDVVSIANFFRNWLKHHKDPEPITFSVEWYAAEIIDRSIDNYSNLTELQTPEMVRFRKEVGRLLIDEDV